ncbi:peptidoglycan-binding protein [Clostridioides sp. ES-S-0123-01]|uniref:peptidoglycan-binding domain-containing protein n=1 Tax=Clostridioides sp. ES-S-0123-01 TaxID=2770783 RepID=UPI001D12BEB3|nr:peptidoglycan-binding protein [Clostridioides sp. ES-S-0123-01]
MFKKARKIVSIICCLLILGSTIVFADTENDVKKESTQKPIAEANFQGYTFTYENAPQQIKDEYDETCKELGIIPEPDAEIFIPIDEVQNYNIDAIPYAVIDNFTVKYYDSFFDVSGSKNYRVYVTTYVGYGHVTSGNPVHLTQLLLKGSGYSLKVDSLFGDTTYSKVKSFQGSHGLTSDGVVGLGTWTKLAQYGL